MKLNTVIIQMSIGGRCIGDAGIHIEDSLSFECLFQSIVQESADSHVLAVLIDIDRSFYSPVVSGTLVERAGVGIAYGAGVARCGVRRRQQLHRDHLLAVRVLRAVAASKQRRYGHGELGA